MNNRPWQDEIKHILKSKGIENEDVSRVISNIDRKDFVREPFKDCAYHDIPLAIGRGQTISQLSLVAFMTQELELEANHHVMEIGTGSGYQTAILSNLVNHVVTIERIRHLHETAQRLLESKYKRRNITFIHADGTSGFENLDPFDRIMVTAAGSDVPSALLNQLKPNGIMIMPIVTSRRDQQLAKLQKTKTKVNCTYLCSVRFVQLKTGLES